MRFTASKEAGNPHADIRRLFAEGVAVIGKKGDEMLFQFPCDNVLFQFLHENIAGVLIDLDDPVDFPVDVLLKHILYSHVFLSFRELLPPALRATSLKEGGNSGSLFEVGCTARLGWGSAYTTLKAL